jgi:hypothetical protein
MKQETTITDDFLPIENPDPSELFAPGGLTWIIERIESESRSLVPDVSTRKGRDAIASIAARVARSKVYLDGLGKDYVAEIKRVSAVIDSERKMMRDRLDALRDELRRPLTEWEEAEKTRVDRIKTNIESIGMLANGELTVSSLRDRLAEAESIEINASWREFIQEATLEKARVIDVLTARLDAAMEKERADAMMRERAKEMEERQRAEREAAEAKEREAAIAAAIEKERMAAERERSEREDQVKRETERLEAKRIEAEQRAALAEDQARRAARAERDRIEAAQAQQRAIEEARAMNEAHRAQVHREILAALMEIVSDEYLAKEIIRAIVLGKIKGLQVEY